MKKTVNQTARSRASRQITSVFATGLAGVMLAAITACDSNPNPSDPSCAYAVSTSLSDFRSAGGSGFATVTSGPGTPACRWTLTSSQPWLTFRDTTSGSAPSTVYFDIGPNPGGSRSAIVRVDWTDDGQTGSTESTVTQQAGPAPAAPVSATFAITSLTDPTKNMCVFTDIVANGVVVPNLIEIQCIFDASTSTPRNQITSFAFRLEYQGGSRLLFNPDYSFPNDPFHFPIPVVKDLRTNCGLPAGDHFDAFVTLEVVTTSGQTVVSERQRVTLLRNTTC